MNELLIITDQADPTHVNEFAYQFALQNGKDITIAQLQKTVHATSRQLVPINKHLHYRQFSAPFDGFEDALEDVSSEVYMPRVTRIDASGFNEIEMIAHIREQNYALVINTAKSSRLDLQIVLNQINCPLMLLPEKPERNEVKRMVYLTDLRYCQSPVVNNLSKMNDVSLLVAHICMQGLPDLVPSYGNQLFNDTLGRYKDKCNLLFTQVKEANMVKVVDTLVNTMKADMLVCMNRQYHFGQLFGNALPKRLPVQVPVPVMVYPC
ncbi:hypothetical protein [Mucilaginibacter auburnensis]|uniref:Universal stress protein family protein n=1 Tax=Mucilaginibacter auburnensis TaxID=1457233 RepID=A0A2H9VMH9_9SPHI|nr:hypothetical protein [Mucilaginibacter auburnensis]PJJ79538.1 hypothetical protein CLV57_2672 [Mucilaginibacter auburnensis]